MTATLPPMTEARFQQQIVAAASIEGWMHYHTYDSRRSVEGFPDLILIKGERMLALEVKTQTGVLKPAQRVWLEALDRVPGITARCVRPSDWDEVVRLLRGTV